MIDDKYINYLRAIVDNNIRFRSFCKGEHNIINSIFKNNIVKYYSGDELYAVVHEIEMFGTDFNYYLIHVTENIFILFLYKLI